MGQGFVIECACRRERPCRCSAEGLQVACKNLFRDRLHVARHVPCRGAFVESKSVAESQK